MGALIRSKDWAATPLGPSETWSIALKTTVSLMLANRFPQLLWWGPDYISIYNDAYRPVLGEKHPRALGKPFREVWPEVAHILGPLIDTPFHGGPASWTDDIQLEVRRHGFNEETHFTFAHSPAPDPMAPRGIGGVLCTVSEITEKVVGERQLAALRELGARTGDDRSAEAACARMAEALAAYGYDAPFALIYLLDEDGRQARLAGVAGAPAGDPAAPEVVELDSDDAAWPLAAAAAQLRPLTVDDLDRRFAQLSPGPWSNPPNTARVVPIIVATRLVGFLVAGVSPRLRLDEGYRAFFDFAAAQIAAGIGDARAYEQERQRAEAMRWLPDAVLAEGVEALPPAAGPQPSILVADDNADMREYLRQLLGQRYRLRLACDGEEALAAIRAAKPDIVLADIMMPRLDGHALLEAIRTDIALADLPVVLLSARAGQEATIEGLHAGADDYLVKPFSARELIARLSAVLERARSRRQLRESEDRFRALVSATSDVVYQMSPDWTEMRALQGRGLLADTDTPSIVWPHAYLPREDQPQILAAIAGAVRTRSPFQLEHRVRQADGSMGWVTSRAVPLVNDRGEITGWFGAASDVTERKRMEEHLRLVVLELNHRVKNNLAMIQSIAAQTFRDQGDGGAAQAAFTARLVAMARANELLTGERWVGVSLEHVLGLALEPYSAGDQERCVVDGPAVTLSSKTALSVALATHELATNAVKYGAWSTPEGKVSVTWTVDEAEDAPRLRLQWRESGGPPVAAPRRRGFGSRLLERGLAAEMGGEVRLDFQPEGLVFSIDAPLSAAEAD